jgi:predicted metal-dependent hydrolase
MHITLHDKSHPIIAVRRKGTRRFVLRWDGKNQAVKLSVPMRGNMQDALKFAHSKKVWLELQKEKSGEHIILRPDMIVSILGERILLKHEVGRGVATYCYSADSIGIEQNLNQLDPVQSPTHISRMTHFQATLTIHGDIAFFSRRLRDWLTKHLRDRITALAQEKAAILGVKFSRIQIRDASSHWGSCSASGTLSFTFKLVFASAAQLEYIVCHEVAHLREMNHSPKFWKLVEQLCPDYAKHRRWLKTHGHELGSIAF